MAKLNYNLSDPLQSNGEKDKDAKTFETIRKQFQKDGYAVFPGVVNQQLVDALNERLEYILRGTYDRGIKPDKSPRLLRSPLPRFSSSTSERDDIEKDGPKQECHHSNSEPAQKEEQEQEHIRNEKNESQKGNRQPLKKPSNNIGPIGFSGNYQNVRVLQVINVHKCDVLFRKFVTDPILGRLVAKLMGWEDGARLAQDQIWAKPPGAPPLSYHRDSPYFMFSPSSVATMWIALDDMTPDLGPLAYVKSSHKWGDGRVGSSQHFFPEKGDGMDLLLSAARREGLKLHSHNGEEMKIDSLGPDVCESNSSIEQGQCKLEFVSMAGLKAGGLSIHDGRTWHGSGRNSSKNKARRGIGLHFVPMNVRWTADARKSSLWKKYLNGLKEDEDVGSLDLVEEDFPVTWTASMVL